MKAKGAALLGLGSELIVLILVSVWAGRSIDTRFEWKGLGVGLLVTLAFIVWFVRIVFLLKSKQGPSSDENGK